jgi:hypothetical protein
VRSEKCTIEADRGRKTRRGQDVCDQSHGRAEFFRPTAMGFDRTSRFSLLTFHFSPLPLPPGLQDQAAEGHRSADAENPDGSDLEDAPFPRR